MPSPITHEHQPTHILEMMERLGIEPGGGVVARLGLSYTTAFHRCENCACKIACRAWIDRAPASPLLAPRFCPNSDIFFELKFDALSCNPAYVGNA
jgi:hypothetical protein